MRSPFPGMDPYLEDPIFWSSFHSRFLVAIADAITPQVIPKYYVEIEARTYIDNGEDDILIGIPDAVVLANKTQALAQSSPTATAVQVRPQRVRVPMALELKERYLQVRELGTDAVITVIELLSPKNKRAGKGREDYEAKRLDILASASHLVEIDFLRAGNPMTMAGATGAMDYHILVSRSNLRPCADLYAFTLQEPIPDFLLPLQAEDEDLLINLQEIFEGVYERSAYSIRLNYTNPVPPPALSESDRRWVQELLQP
jgi:Protein of unknown function (DUF4058)